MIKKLVSIFLVFALCFAPAAVFSSEAEETGDAAQEPAAPDTVTQEPAADEDNADAAPAKPVAPSAPSNVKAAGRDYNKIKVSW